MGRLPRYRGVIVVQHQKETPMTRPRTFSIAAVLMLIYSLIAIAFEIPNLMLGMGAQTQYNGDGPPFVLVLVNVVAGAMGIVAAFGVWRMQKWAVVLTIVLASIGILTSLPAMLFAPGMLKLGGAGGAAMAIVIIALLLWPQPKERPAASHAH
jgi:uncharacterized membrane protein (DUF2068 family)